MSVVINSRKFSPRDFAIAKARIKHLGMHEPCPIRFTGSPTITGAPLPASLKSPKVRGNQSTPHKKETA